MQAGTLSVLPRGPQWWGLEGDGAAGLVGLVVVVQRLQHAHPGLYLVLRGRIHLIGTLTRVYVHIHREKGGDEKREGETKRGENGRYTCRYM